MGRAISICLSSCQRVFTAGGQHRNCYREIKGLAVPFDIVVATAQDLERHKDNAGLIYKNALKEGIEVYGL